MADRWIKIAIHGANAHDKSSTIEEEERFIDLAHALWSVAQTSGVDFTLSVDRHANIEAYNARWAELGKSAPWER
jgi:hypothetical protein